MIKYLKYDYLYYIKLKVSFKNIVGNWKYN